IDAGLEPVRVIGEFARQAGLHFLPSVRMNDLHFTCDPLQSPLTPQFWFDHQDLVVRSVPKEISSWYEHAPDFTHDVVRQYRMDLIDEILERFADTVDGIELDFLRHPVFLPDGEGPARGHLVTDMVRRVRARLQQMSEASGRPHWLLVRAPTDLDSCRRVGLEVDLWIEQKLIDVVIPASHYFATYDMPIDSVVDVARAHGCRVHPSLFPSHFDAWPFDIERAVPPAPYVKHGPIISPRRMRGAAANYWRMGVDGLAVYNLHLDRTAHADTLYRMLRDLAAPACLRRADKIFAITKSTWLSDHPVSFRKQLPADLAADQPQTFTLIIGEDFDDRRTAPLLDRCVLRAGLRRIAPSVVATIEVNGTRLPTSDLAPVKGSPAVFEKHPLLAEAFVNAPIEDRGCLRQGPNEIRIALDQPATVTDIEMLATWRCSENA
ncbi:MAG: hypothetical protein CMJ18_08420, partial [Phycisphaeraceae bacterium]|nr:hypothetical protein [Phycisphaeraceae bacterium]